MLWVALSQKEKQNDFPPPQKIKKKFLDEAAD